MTRCPDRAGAGTGPRPERIARAFTALIASGALACAGGGRAAQADPPLPGGEESVTPTVTVTGTRRAVNLNVRSYSRWTRILELRVVS